VRELTLEEVIEKYGGILPPDAVLRPDDDERAARPVTPPPPKRHTRSERFAALNAFVDFGVASAGLTPAEAIVWLVLFRDTKSDGTARTGQADIARRAGLSVRSVKLALRNLRSKGLVRVVRRGRLNAGPSTYRVHPTGRMG
jgi:CRP-like cAMP-binding protein